MLHTSLHVQKSEQVGMLMTLKYVSEARFEANLRASEPGNEVQLCQYYSLQYAWPINKECLQ
jgi:hypothetical protein